MDLVTHADMAIKAARQPSMHLDLPDDKHTYDDPCSDCGTPTPRTRLRTLPGQRLRRMCSACFPKAKK